MPDIEALEIARSKTLANSEKYFSLFEKYLNDSFNSCLLFEIGNEDVICKIMEKNPNARYFIYDNVDIKDILKAVIPDYNKIKFCDDDKLKPKEVFNKMESTVKFDKIIMNPPYSRNLHLKVLEKAIQHLTDDGNCVNLSPVRWLQDPLAQYKKNSDYHKFEDSVSKHIKNIEIYDTKHACDIFQAGILMDLGIYSLTNKTYNLYKNLFKNDIIEKIFKNAKHLIDVLENNKIDGWRWTMCDIQPMTAQSGKVWSYGWYRRFCIYNHLRSTIYFDGYKDGKEWVEFNSGIKKESGSLMPSSIKFNSEKEAINFENSLKTTFYHYCVNQMKMDQHTPWNGLPWMGDEINPRTGKKGYESEWTDADFYKFFNITEDEQKIIEKTMEKYK